MRPTLEYLYNKFDYYNRLCFGGKLQQPVIRLNTRKASLGLTRVEHNCHSGEETVLIEISIRQDLPEEEYIDTLLHEMIHYYLLTNHLHDDAPHGSRFMAEMNRITSTYGLRITVEYAPSEQELMQTRSRWRFVCVAEFEDGHTAVTIVAKNNLFRFWDQLPDFPGVVRLNWYTSDSAVFEAYPSGSRPTFYPVDPAKLTSYLTGAKQLKRVGNTIRPVSE